MLGKNQNEFKRISHAEHQAILLHLGSFHSSKSGDIYLCYGLDQSKIGAIMDQTGLIGSRPLEVLAGRILSGAFSLKN